MREAVERDFNEYLKRLLASKPEVLKAVLRHERKKLCIDNLCREISKAELSNLGLNGARRLYLIQDIAKLFAKTALEHMEQELLTKAEKQRRIDQADRETRDDGLLIEGKTVVTEL